MPAPALVPEHTAASAAAAGRPALPRLTTLRGVAALIVFWFHAFGELLSTDEGFNNTLVNAVAGPGEASVGLFFMLSGFVLVWVSRPTDTARRFYRRRIAKVYPNSVVTWFFGLAAFIAVGREFNIFALLPSLLLVQVWFPKASVIEGTNGPAWTLACEMFFYLLFPWLAVRASSLRRARLWPVAFALVGAMLAWTLFVAFAVPTEPRTEVGPAVPIAQAYTLFFLPPVRLLEFAAGMLLAHIVLDGRWPKVANQHVAAAFVAAYVLSLVIPAPLGYLFPFIPGIVLLVGSAATSDLAGRSSWLTSRTMIWFGEVSFGFYLTHWIVLRNLRLLISRGEWPIPATIGYWFLCLGISLVLGRMLYTHVEVPAVRRWARSRRSQTAVEPSPPVPPAPVIPPAVNPTYAEHARAAGLDWPPRRSDTATPTPAPSPDGDDAEASDASAV